MLHEATNEQWCCGHSRARLIPTAPPCAAQLDSKKDTMSWQKSSAQDWRPDLGLWGTVYACHSQNTEVRKGGKVHSIRRTSSGNIYTSIFIHFFISMHSDKEDTAKKAKPTKTSNNITSTEAPVRNHPTLHLVQDRQVKKNPIFFLLWFKN